VSSPTPVLKINMEESSDGKKEDTTTHVHKLTHCWYMRETESKRRGQREIGTVPLEIE